MSERGIDDNLAKISQKVTKGNILENKSNSQNWNSYLTGQSPRV